jgi:hypothetical protein
MVCDDSQVSSQQGMEDTYHVPFNHYYNRRFFVEMGIGERMLNDRDISNKEGKNSTFVIFA